MGAPLDFSDIPAAPPQAQQNYAPGPAVFTDTGAPGTTDQSATYQTLAQTGGYDPNAAPGSIRNPYGLRPGASIPAGAYYADTHGGVYQAGPGGVQLPAAAQTPQEGAQGGSSPGAGMSATPLANAAPAPSSSQQLGGAKLAANGGLNFDDVAPANQWGDDLALSIPTGVVHAATGVAGLAGNIGDLTDKGVQMAANSVRGLFGYQPITLPHNNPLGPNVPDSADLNHAIESVTGPLYQPQTAAGRAVETALSYAPGAALGPEGLTARALSVAVPAATSDIAGETARAFAPQYEGAARVVGGLVGGFGMGAVTSAPGDVKVLASGSGNLSDADLAATQALRQKAASIGINLTIPEATAQATGKGGAYLQAQRAVEGTPAGASTMGPYMAARPRQMQNAVNGFVGQISPTSAPPSVVGPQAANAAEGALTAERQAINARATPAYDASRNDLIDPASYASLASDPSYQAVLKAVRSDPERAHLIAGLPDNSVGVVDQVGKQLQTAADQARGSEVVPGDLQLAGLRQASANRAFQVAEASSPTYAAARQTVAQGRAATLDPLTAGPLGQISKTQNLGQQAGALFPTAPFPGAPGETSEALTRMGSIDPTAPGSLVGAHLGRAAAEAFSDTRNGPNLYGGSKFALDVAGNPLQRQNLQAGVSAAAGSDTGAQLDPLTQALMATGRRLPPRQATSQELGAALSASPINAGELGVATSVPIEAAHNPAGALVYPALKLASKGAEKLAQARAAGNASALAKAFTAPADRTSAFIGAARTQDELSRQMLAAALAGTAASSGQQP